MTVGHTRSQNWVLIALISASYVGAGILLNLTGHYSLNDLGVTAAFGALNAVLCTGLGDGRRIAAARGLHGTHDEAVAARNSPT